MITKFENFPVYKKIMIAVREINYLCLKLKNSDYRYLKDQIRRASSSVLLNLAEGSIKWSKKDKANFYRISQASACESIAALDLFILYGIAPVDDVERIKENLRDIIGDLNALVLSIDRRKK